MNDQKQLFGSVVNENTVLCGMYRTSRCGYYIVLTGCEHTGGAHGRDSSGVCVRADDHTRPDQQGVVPTV